MGKGGLLFLKKEAGNEITARLEFGRKLFRSRTFALITRSEACRCREPETCLGLQDGRIADDFVGNIAPGLTAKLRGRFFAEIFLREILNDVAQPLRFEGLDCARLIHGCGICRYASLCEVDRNFEPRSEDGV